MKIQLCDVCLAEGTLSQSLYTSGFKRAKFHLCMGHKDYAHSFKTELQAMEEVLKLETKGIDFLNANINAIKKR